MDKNGCLRAHQDEKGWRNHAILSGGGTENLPPVIIRHAGWLRGRCASCGSANFIVQDDNDAISINALDQTAGRRYVRRAT